MGGVTHHVGGDIQINCYITVGRKDQMGRLETFTDNSLLNIELAVETDIDGVGGSVWIHKHTD